MSPAPLHVLLVTTGYPPEHSGSGGRLHALYQRLAAQHPGLTWSVLCRRAGNTTAIPGPAALYPVPQAGNARRPVVEWAAIHHHRAIFAQCDVMHCAGWSWLTLAACRAAKRARLPILRELTTVGDGGARRSAGARLIRHTNRLADQVIAISPALERDARTGGVTAPIWCRPNPVDSKKFFRPRLAQRQAARALLRRWFPDLADGDILLLLIGRIRPLKNQKFLLHALGHLPKKFKLLIVGPPQGADDPYLRECQTVATAPDLAGRVFIEARLRQDVAEIMRGADMLVFPSREEGLGNVVVEALASGLPVVANRLPGVTDWLITPATNGELATLDTADFAAAMTRAAPLTEHRTAIAAAAATRFDSAAIDAQYWQILTGLAVGKQRAAA
jgi:glycosyltransferase involved in cell wall biosynthesis